MISCANCPVWYWSRNKPACAIPRQRPPSGAARPFCKSVRALSIIALSTLPRSATARSMAIKPARTAASAFVDGLSASFESASYCLSASGRLPRVSNIAPAVARASSRYWLLASATCRYKPRASSGRLVLSRQRASKYFAESATEPSFDFAAAR